MSGKDPESSSGWLLAQDCSPPFFIFPLIFSKVPHSLSDNKNVQGFRRTGHSTSRRLPERLHVQRTKVCALVLFLSPESLILKTILIIQNHELELSL